MKFKSHAYTFSGSQNSQIANHRANKQAKKAKASNEIEIEFAFREALLFIVVAAPKPRNEKKEKQQPIRASRWHEEINAANMEYMGERTQYVIPYNLGWYLMTV